MLTINDFCNKAIEYIDTPFKHQGRLKNKGLDCCGLVVCVAKECEIYTGGDRKDYSRIPDGHMMLENLREHLIEVDLKDIQPGDVLLMKFENEPQHVAIYMPNNEIIHSYATLGKVTKHQYSQDWKDKTIAAFRFPAFYN